MKVKNWLFGISAAIAMLFCSVSFAVETPILMPVPSFDVVTVTADEVDVLVSTDALSRPNSDGIFDIGAGSAGIIAYIGDGSMAVSNHKTTDNVTAYIARPLEVGWR